jgi:hypothetical protein
LGSDGIDRVEREVEDKGLTLARHTAGGVLAYMAQGWLGQGLVILPKTQVVAVRQIRHKSGYDPETDEFTDFFGLLRALT